MLSTMTIRTDPAVKAQAQKVFADLGMDMTTAINVFLRQAIRYNGFPFEVRNPEPSTLTYSVLDDVKHGRNLNGPFDSVEALMEDLDA